MLAGRSVFMGVPLGCVQSSDPVRVEQRPNPIAGHALSRVMVLELQQPLAPMEAVSVDTVPEGAAWQYEPKWDGFRCIAFRDGKTVTLQSKAGQPLTRYFPELVEALAALEAKRFVLDGEI